MKMLDASDYDYIHQLSPVSGAVSNNMCGKIERRRLNLYSRNM